MTLTASKEYEVALTQACELLDMCEGLEPRSALKQCASDNGIADGADMQSFILWAEAEMYGE